MAEDISKVSNGRIVQAVYFSTKVVNGRGVEEFVCASRERLGLWVLERGGCTPQTITTVKGLRQALYNIAQLWDIQ